MQLVQIVILLASVVAGVLAEYHLPQLEYGPPMKSFYISKKQYGVPTARPHFPPYEVPAFKPVPIIEAPRIPSTSYGVPDLIYKPVVTVPNKAHTEYIAPAPVDSYGVPVKPHIIYEIPTTTTTTTTTTTQKPRTTTKAPKKPEITYGPPTKPPTGYGVPTTTKHTTTRKPTTTPKPVTTTKIPSKPTDVYGPPITPETVYGVPTTVKTTTTPRPTTTRKPTTTTPAPTKPTHVYGPPTKPSNVYGILTTRKPVPPAVVEYGVPNVVTDIPFKKSTTTSKPDTWKPYPPAGVPQHNPANEYMIPAAHWELDNDNSPYSSHDDHYIPQSSTYIIAQKSHIHEIHRPHFFIPKISGGKLFPFSFPRLSFYK